MLIVKEKEEEFIQALKDMYAPVMLMKDLANLSTSHEEFYPTATGGVHLSPDIARLVNDRQFQRAKNFLEKTNGKIVLGGGMDAEKLFMAPTVVKGVSADDILMSEWVYYSPYSIFNSKCLHSQGDFCTHIAYPNCRSQSLVY